MKVYLAHPVTDYGKHRQADAIAAIVAAGHEVENPDQPHHQAGYDSGGMAYFERIAAECDGLAFMRFPDGAIGAGVAKEIAAAHGAGKPVWEVFGGRLHPVGNIVTPILTVDETRALIRFLRATA